jgi:hypothetical protein
MFANAFDGVTGGATPSIPCSHGASKIPKNIPLKTVPSHIPTEKRKNDFGSHSSRVQQLGHEMRCLLKCHVTKRFLSPRGKRWSQTGHLLFIVNSLIGIKISKTHPAPP